MPATQGCCLRHAGSALLRHWLPRYLALARPVCNCRYGSCLTPPYPWLACLSPHNICPCSTSWLGYRWLDDSAPTCACRSRFIPRYAAGQRATHAPAPHRPPPTWTVTAPTISDATVAVTHLPAVCRAYTYCRAWVVLTRCIPPVDYAAGL